MINGLFAADHVIVTLDSGSFALNGVTTLSTIFSDIKESLGKEIWPDMAIVSRWGEGLLQSCAPRKKRRTRSFYEDPEYFFPAARTFS